MPKVIKNSDLYISELKALYSCLKRIFDVFFAIIIGIFTLPIMIIIVAIIKIETSENPLFRQKRTGIENKPFNMYKFRTMTFGQGNIGTQIKQIENPKITKFGNFLRKSHLDELPQLWNVLQGDMSLVGPRPEQVKLAAFFNNEIPLYSSRHEIRPGITGWAQVNTGDSTDIESTKRKLEYDLFYIENRNILFDFKILVITFKIFLLRGKLKKDG